MATSPLPRLISVAEFQAMPEPDGEFGWELHAGEIVSVTRPKNRHLMLQVRLMALLGEQAPSGSFVSMEMPFCAFPEYDMRVADVGYTSPERWAATDPDGNLQGAPDVTIEILSPSNKPREMADKCVLCLTHGSKQFWIVDDKNRRVHINYDDKTSKSFSPGDQIPMDLLGPGKTLDVSRIFDES